MIKPPDQPGACGSVLARRARALKMWKFNDGPEQMKAYEIRASGIDALHFCDRDIRAPGPGEVLVRVRASSINFRDYLNVLDPVGRGISMPRTPNSDAAGEVVEVGEGVSRGPMSRRCSPSAVNWRTAWPRSSVR